MRICLLLSRTKSGGKTFYLYRITNTINWKVYIGQAKDLLRRWSQHKSAAKYAGVKCAQDVQVITRAIAKYGPDAFVFEEIAECLTQEDADIIEAELIVQYDSRNPKKGYNVAAGGNTTPRTPEVVAKIVASRKKYFETHDGWNKGGTLTEEWKNKISQSHIGLPGTNTGKTFDDEWRGRISASLTGKKFSEERIRNLSESHKGQLAPNRKLTFEIAEQIREEYSRGNTSQKKLGIKYGLSQACIFNIIKRQTYNK